MQNTPIYRTLNLGPKGVRYIERFHCSRSLSSMPAQDVLGPLIISTSAQDLLGLLILIKKLFLVFVVLYNIQKQQLP
jgi:hypothetical protein